ncbi:MAG TPA: hypothetical protein VG206_24740 [Terriglobia bacterium]|nr:hypothetical protein [Terriglobia bacterium]
MSPDIERAIEQLEAKIAELISARDTLIETFDPPDSPRRRLVLARRASSAAGVRKHGQPPSAATAGSGITADSAVSGSVRGATVASQGANQGGAQGVELDYQNLGRRITRKDALAEFLREHGPSARAEILHGLAIPPGSIAYVLNDKNRFVLVEGKWHNVPGQETGQEPDRKPASEGAGADEI